MAAGNWTFFSLKKIKKPEELTSSDNTILTLAMAIFIVAMSIMYFLNLFDKSWFSYLALFSIWGAVAGRVFIFVYAHVKGEAERIETRGDIASTILIVSVLLSSLFFLLASIFDIGIYTALAEAWCSMVGGSCDVGMAQILVFVLVQYVILSVIGYHQLYKSYMVREWVAFGFVASALVASLLLILVGILNWNGAFDFTSMKEIIFWGPIIALAVAAAIILIRTPAENRKRATQIVALGFGVSVAVIAIFFNPYLSFSGTAIPWTGQMANPFETIWALFFTSETAAIMIALMTFGAITFIFARTLGDLMQAGQAVGAMIMVVPPLLIIMQIFTGFVPIPDLLADLLGGPSVAAFVYGLAQVGVFTIMMTILMTFTGMIQLLIRQ